LKALLLPLALAWSGTTVVHFGDSHVASGLTSGLREHFRAQGARYYSDYWVSSSTPRWAYSERLADMLRRRHPDVVIVTLGSNEAYMPNPVGYARHMRRLVARLQTVGLRDARRSCFWIGPPRYEHLNVDRIVAVQQQNATPCRYFDSRAIDAPRGHTRLHFTREGGVQWADAIWNWMNEAGEVPGEIHAASPPVAAIPQ